MRHLPRATEILGKRRSMRHYRSHKRRTHPVPSAGRPATTSLDTGISDFRARTLRLLTHPVSIGPVWRTDDAKTMATMLMFYTHAVESYPTALLRHDDGIWDNPQGAFAWTDTGMTRENKRRMTQNGPFGTPRGRLCHSSFASLRNQVQQNVGIATIRQDCRFIWLSLFTR